MACDGKHRRKKIARLKRAIYCTGKIRYLVTLRPLLKQLKFLTCLRVKIFCILAVEIYITFLFCGKSLTIETCPSLKIHEILKQYYILMKTSIHKDLTFRLLLCFCAFTRCKNVPIGYVEMTFASK